MGDRWGATTDGATDRLAALRIPPPDRRTAASPSSSRKKLSRELILGVLLLLIGAFLVLVFVGRRQPSPVVMPAATPGPVQSNTGEVVRGKALVSAFVEQGNYPPELSEGDPVVIILTPVSSSEGVTRMLPETAKVASIHESSGGSFGAVIALLAAETVARDVADAGSVHLAIVSERD